jgi:hypothetical protein
MPEELTRTEATAAEDSDSGSSDSPAGMGNFLTRGEVAEVLRVSIATIRRWQGKDLHPRRDDTGMYLFDPQEVEAFRARRPPPPETRRCEDSGELGAEAFMLFREGVDVRDVVIALRRPPEEIWALYKQWETMGDAIVLSKEVHEQLSRLARHRLIPDAVLEAMENDDYEMISDYINNSLAARTNRKRG